MDSTKKPSIKEWTLDDRPREKLLTRGAEQLSTPELLAILIGSGNPEEDAVQLMRRVLNECDDSLVKLGRMAPEELCRTYKGIGTAKAVTILAACELGRRRQGEESRRSHYTVTCPADIHRYYRELLQDTYVEECHVMLLNQAHRVIGSRLISRGGIAQAVVDVREVLRSALLLHATTIALCHNHPSGSLTPSRDDDALTHKLQQAAHTMDIKLLDHIIVATDGFYSYAEHGKLP